MTRSVTRRRFLATAAALSAASALEPLSRRLGVLAAAEAPGLAVVKGNNWYDAAVRAVDMLGGMKKFVPRGARVGLLVNSSFDKPGTYTKPQIALAVAALCMEAGAAEIISLEDASGSYWRRATLSKDHQDLVDGIKSPSGTITVPVRQGTRLKEVGIVRDFMECDVLINVPVFKDHEGTHFTGNLKNIMGATSGSTNRYFHMGAGGVGYYAHPEHLSECIAEANTIRTPTLCVGDGTEVISTNGPFGPGKVIRPLTVVAGTDPVNVDAFGATLLGLRPEEILMIRRAAELGIGTMDLKARTIERAEV